MELEKSMLDSLWTKNIVFEFEFNLEGIKLVIVEKKFLLSQQNEILVALSSNNLVSLHNFELFGKFNFDMKLDEYLLRPAS